MINFYQLADEYERVNGLDYYEPLVGDLIEAMVTQDQELMLAVESCWAGLVECRV